MKHCFDDKYGNFSTFEDAKSNCTAGSNCQGVYDDECDSSGSYYLCPLNVALVDSSSSCVYTKLQGSCSFKWQ